MTLRVEKQRELQLMRAEIETQNLVKTRIRQEGPKNPWFGRGIAVRERASREAEFAHAEAAERQRQTWTR